jgi:vitamin B12 transporter
VIRRLAPVFILGVAWPWALATPLQAQETSSDRTKSQQTGDHQQKAAPAPEAPRFRDAVTVIADPLDVPGSSITVLDRQDIVDSGVVSLPELLREVAGVHVSETGSRAGVITAEVRGGDPTHTLVLVDGVLMNDGNDNLGDVYNLGGLTLDDVERVEIIRGPASSVYGSRALAGVIHIVTRQARPGDDALSGSLQLGSFSQTRATAAVGGVRGDSDGRIAVGWEKEAGRVGNDSYKGAVAHINAGTRVRGREVRLRGRWGHTEGDDYSDASGGPEYGDGALRHGVSDDGSFNLHWTLAEGTRRQALDANVRLRSLQRDSPAIGPAVPASTQDSDLTRLRLAWEGSLLLGKHHVLTTSADVERESGHSNNALLLAPGVTIPGIYQIDRTTGGLFAGFSGSQVGLSYGATLRLDVPQGHAAQLSPRLSAAWGPVGGHWRVRASGGRAFKLPSFYALGSPRALGGNPDLRPETSIGGDAGVDLTLGPASLSVTAYAQRYRDLIDFDFDTLQLVNRSQVRSRGVEATGKLTPVSSLSLNASVTYLHSQIVGSDAKLLHQPAWTGEGGVTWSPWSPLRLHLEAYAVSQSLDQEIPVPDRQTVAGYTWLACAVSWHLHDGVALEGRVDNLADRAYETFIGFPGPGRSVRVGLTVGGPKIGK